MSREDDELAAEVVVVGLGAFGSSALWQLAVRGVDAIGIEQFAVGHDLGSSHGASRLFRIACMEHNGLAPLAARAGELWERLGDAYGSALLMRSGLVTIGAPDSEIVTGAVAAAASSGINLEHLTAAQLRERYPLHGTVPDTHVGVRDASAGVVQPEAGVVAAVSEARRLGAQVWERTGVRAIERAEDGAWHVHAGERVIRADRVIVAAGAWLGNLVPGLELVPRRTPMTWFAPAQGARIVAADGDDAVVGDGFGIEALPAFIRQVDDETVIWGHGAVWGHGVKVGLADSGPEFEDCDPDTVDRDISPQRDWKQVGAAVAAALPGLDPVPQRSIVCMVTNTPDRQFLIGALADRPGLIVGGGCSGHGFKHATAIGEHLAQLAVGEVPTVELEFCEPARFAIV